MRCQMNKLPLACIVCIGFALGWVVQGRLTGQERDPSYPQTKQWGIPLRQTDRDRSWNHRVQVIETAGVCLYVVLNDNDFHSAVWGLPKKDLPAGVGCQ